METEQKIRIHQLVEYIKQDPEFPFDTHDELEDILAYYDIDAHLGSEARVIVSKEVRRIAEAAQTFEITRLVEKEISLLDLVR